MLFSHYYVNFMPCNEPKIYYLNTVVYVLESVLEKRRDERKTLRQEDIVLDTFYRIVSLLGGLALFLYGMRIMGDGLKSSSGGALKNVLSSVTDRPVKGFLLGMAVTCMIQSSTATIVLTVGLVGAGFLTFRQSTGIVLGANVGTAITAQIIRLMDVEAGAGSILYFFKSDNLAPMALIVGIILIMFVSTRTSDVIGTVCMGFGILFVGLMNMSSAVTAFGQSLSNILVSFEDNYFLGFLSGALVTGIIQSSSAVIGILQSIASSVGVTFSAIFAVVIGVNIGDCLTTYLVCRIGAKPEQIRTCMIHIIYNVCAAVLLFVSIFILRSTGVLGDELWYATLRSGGVANVHGLFRLVPAVIFLPAAGFLEKMAVRIIPDTAGTGADDEEQDYLRELDMRLISNPSMALLESRHLIGRMGEEALQNYDAVIAQISGWSDEADRKVLAREDTIDRMTDASNQYIVSVAQYITLDSDTVEQNFQLQAMTCIERIGDLAVNIEHNLQEMNAQGKTFSDSGRKELGFAFNTVRDILELAIEGFENEDDTLMIRVEPLEEVIDEMIETLRGRHSDRMVRGKCDVVSGMHYQNILLHLERVSDQCSDLAVYQLGRNNDDIRGQEHQYLHNLHHSEDKDYMTSFHSYYSKYYYMLDEISAEEGMAPPEESSFPDETGVI